MLDLGWFEQDQRDHRARRVRTGAAEVAMLGDAQEEHFAFGVWGIFLFPRPECVFLTLRAVAVSHKRMNSFQGSKVAKPCECPIRGSVRRDTREHAGRVFYPVGSGSWDVPGGSLISSADMGQKDAVRRIANARIAMRVLVARSEARLPNVRT